PQGQPERWTPVAEALARSSDPDVREKALLVGLALGDAQARPALEAVLLDPSVKAERRLRALQALSDQRATGLAPRLRSLLGDPALRAPAIRALAAYDDPETPRALLAIYPGLHEAEKDDAIAVLASRSSFSAALLDAIEAGKVPRRDVSVT